MVQYQFQQMLYCLIAICFKGSLKIQKYCPSLQDLILPLLPIGQKSLLNFYTLRIGIIVEIFKSSGKTYLKRDINNIQQGSCNIIITFVFKTTVISSGLHWKNNNFVVHYLLTKILIYQDRSEFSLLSNRCKTELNGGQHLFLFTLFACDLQMYQIPVHKKKKIGTPGTNW